MADSNNAIADSEFFGRLHIGGRLFREQGLEPYDTGWIWKELKREPPG